MKVIEKTGKTTEDAIALGLNELGVTRDKVTIEIIEEPSKRGIFSFLSNKMAKVRLIYKDSPIDIATAFLDKVCSAMGISAAFQCQEDDNTVNVNITGPDLGILIGRRGDTLDALQYLLNLSVQKHFTERVRIVLDVEGYRQRREETLIRLAKRLAERVKRTGYRVVLEPMSPQERRIIHTALQDDPNVFTFSEGDEPFRKVVISMKGK